MATVPTIQAIRTTYQGITFRSRTEARWARFLDELGIQWQFEAEGYELPGHGRYLPDFWLPQLDCFLEIKGGHDYETSKVAKASHVTQKRIFVAPGTPEILRFFYDPANHASSEGLDAYTPADTGDPEPRDWAHWDNQYAFGVCGHGRIGVEFMAPPQMQRHCRRTAIHDESPRSRCEPGAWRKTFLDAIDSAMRHSFWEPQATSSEYRPIRIVGGKVVHE